MRRNFNPSEQTLDQLVVTFPRYLILAGELATRVGDKEIFAPYGLTVPKYSLLVSLNAAGGSLPMTELRNLAFVSISLSNLTLLVDDLESKEWVKRVPSPTDRRVSLVQLTLSGSDLLCRVAERERQFTREAFATMDTLQLQNTVSLLHNFIEQASELLGLKWPHRSDPSHGR